jgi:hypothetical protein
MIATSWSGVSLSSAGSPRLPGTRPRRSVSQSHALHLLGDVAAHPDRVDAERGEAEAHYRNALALAEACAMRPLVAHCHLGLGKLCRDTGKSQEAQERLTTATAMYRDMAMRFWLEDREGDAAP